MESRTLRSRHVDRVDVFDKVKALATLPGNQYATVKQVAEFYEVPTETVRSAVKDHRSELESNGLHILAGSDLQELKDKFRKDLSSAVLKSARLMLFTRTAVLNVGMLLTESEVARQVRAYLLTVEATATVEHKTSAVQLMRLQERMDYQHILRALKLGGAVSDDYRTVQNSLYMGLFGKTAAQIRATQPQRTGTPRVRGEGFRKSNVAKDHLTEDQLRCLNSAVLAVTALIQLHFRHGASVAELIDAANRAVALVTTKPRQLGGVA